jgi:hypothetical protein
LNEQENMTEWTLRSVIGLLTLVCPTSVLDSRCYPLLQVHARKPSSTLTSTAYGLTGSSHICRYTKLSPMNIQFDALSWMCSITGPVSLLSDDPGNNVDLPW